MTEPATYNLLLTNYRRVRWLWWGLLVFFGVGGGLLALRIDFAFGLLLAGCSGLLMLIIAYNKIFRQPAWVLVADDGIAWANPVVDPPTSLKFEEIRTYRFELYKQGMKLFLYLRSGEKETLDGRFDEEFAAMEQHLNYAVRRYNQAHPDAAIAQEKTFFERPISGKVLLGLLAASAVWVAWNISQQAAAGAYFPVVMVLVPYLGTWAAYSGRRE